MCLPPNWTVLWDTLYNWHYAKLYATPCSLLAAQNWCKFCTLSDQGCRSLVMRLLIHRSLVWCSSLHGWASLACLNSKARAKRQYEIVYKPLADNFRTRVGACIQRIEPFLHASAHFQMLSLDMSASTFSVKRNAVGNIAKPIAVPMFGSLLLLQPRTTTVVTKSHWRSRNSTLYGKFKILCLPQINNTPL